MNLFQLYNFSTHLRQLAIGDEALGTEDVRVTPVVEVVVETVKVHLGPMFEG